MTRGIPPDSVRFPHMMALNSVSKERALTNEKLLEWQLAAQTKQNQSMEIDRPTLTLQCKSRLRKFQMLLEIILAQQTGHWNNRNPHPKERKWRNRVPRKRFVLHSDKQQPKPAKGHLVEIQLRTPQNQRLKMIRNRNESDGKHIMQISYGAND